MKKTGKILGFIALVAVIGFGMAACSHSSDESTIPSELQGSWKWQSGSNVTTIITDKTTVGITESGAGDPDDNGTYVITVDDAQPFTVPAPFNVNFPKGYTLTGEITFSNVPNKPSGYPVEVHLGLNTAKDKFLELDSFNEFTKQP